MKHFAKIVNDQVVEVMMSPSWEDFSEVLKLNNEWIETSPNAHNGIYYNLINGERDDTQTALRKNFAKPGYLYDRVLDEFNEPLGPVMSIVDIMNSSDTRLSVFATLSARESVELQVIIQRVLAEMAAGTV